LGGQYNVIVNGFNLGVVQTASEVPAVGMRWGVRWAGPAKEPEPAEPSASEPVQEQVPSVSEPEPAEPPASEPVQEQEPAEPPASEPVQEEEPSVVLKERRLYDGLVPIINFIPGVNSNWPWFKTKGNDVVNVVGRNCHALTEAMSYDGLSDADKLIDNQTIVFWIHHLFLHDVIHVGCSDAKAESSEDTVYKEGCGGCARAKNEAEKNEKASFRKKQKTKNDSSSRSSSSSSSSSSSGSTRTSSSTRMSSSSSSALDRWMSGLSESQRQALHEEGQKMFGDLDDKQEQK
jgi:hypothetical protein